MKILWVCNTMTPEIAKELKVNSVINVSWIVNTLEQLKKAENIEMGICFPLKKVSKIKAGTADGVSFFGFPQKETEIVYDNNIEIYFDEIIQKFSPDVVHIWGTEYSHTLSMMKACQKHGLLDRTAISIQGLCYIYAKHYYAMLDEKILRRYTLRDLLRRNNIKWQKKGFEKRGKFEIEALKLTKNVIGRTDWDEACTKQINPDIKYHFCNETLRESFYKNEWDIEKCERHSLFVSQGHYPLKGLHFVLDAIRILKKDYSDIKLYVGGFNSVNRGWKTSSYGKYIKELIDKYDISDNVIFTGMLNEEKMCKQYLKSNVFVLASSIENSPNSVGEAMILGMPVVSSDVGGVKNLMTHGKEGYVYPYDEAYMIAYYVKKIFEDDNLAKGLGEKAKLKAMNTHDREKNLEDLIGIYKTLNRS